VLLRLLQNLTVTKDNQNLHVSVTVNELYDVRHVSKIRKMCQVSLYIDTLDQSPSQANSLLAVQETSGPLVCSQRLAILSQINTVCVYFLKTHFNITSHLYLVSRDSSVVLRRDTGWTVHASNPGRGNTFYTLQNVQTGPRIPQPPSQWVPGFFLRNKAADARS
jgi:hypothetical protein